jgi:holin-like protein
MLRAILTLLALQCLGDEIATVASLPIPGMVIGMILLFSALSLRKWKLGDERAVPVALGRLANHLHSNFRPPDLRASAATGVRHGEAAKP